MKIAFAVLAALLAIPGQMTHSPQADGARPDLYGEAAQAMLNRSFPSQRIEYLLFDLRENRIEAMRWNQPDQPLPFGSLLKPFVALAYAGLQVGDRPIFPVVTCHGASDGCWRSLGHGSMTLERAVAESCNAYFLTLARAVAASPDGVLAMGRVSNRYGLPPPFGFDGGVVAAPDLIGLTTAWRVRPPALVRAYARLFAEPLTPVTARLREGMRMAAVGGGTASHVGRHAGGVLAKTGTAPCAASADEPCLANGDGGAIVAFPAEEPRQVLLVRERGTTGAEAAATAGAMLSLLEKSDAMAR